MYLEALVKKGPLGPDLEMGPQITRRAVLDGLETLWGYLEGRAAALAAELAPPPKPRVQIKESVAYPPGFEPTLALHSSHFLGLWRYPEHADTCAICRTALAAPCVNCESHQEGHTCLVQWGSCKHAYHTHCIRTWVEQRNACPICQQPWEPLHEESPLQ